MIVFWWNIISLAALVVSILATTVGDSSVAILTISVACYAKISAFEAKEDSKW